MNKCIICGKETKNKKFCSISCKSISMSKEKGNCLNCGKKLTRCDTKFCSKECSLVYQKIQYLKTKNLNKCIICGKETENKKYCSMKCLGKDKNRIPIAVNNLKNSHCWTDEEISYLKNNYGKLDIDIISKNLHIGKNAIIAFASKNSIKSAKKWSIEEISFLKENNYMDIKEISKILNSSPNAIMNKFARLNGFEDEKGKKKMSIQQFVFNYVKSLNLVPLEEVRIGKFRTDILIYNLDIEVQGTIWHCDERFFDYKNLNEEQKKRVLRDKTKKDFFEKKGIEILYLWEYDILSNPEKCQNIILKKLKEKNIYTGKPNSNP